MEQVPLALKTARLLIFLAFRADLLEVLVVNRGLYLALAATASTVELSLAHRAGPVTGDLDIQFLPTIDIL